jgi:hypothetical protein
MVGVDVGADSGGEEDAAVWDGRPTSARSMDIKNDT